MNNEITANIYRNSITKKTRFNDYNYVVVEKLVELFTETDAYQFVYFKKRSKVLYLSTMDKQITIKFTRFKKNLYAYYMLGGVIYCANLGSNKEIFEMINAITDTIPMEKSDRIHHFEHIFRQKYSQYYANYGITAVIVLPRPFRVVIYVGRTPYLVNVREHNRLGTEEYLNYLAKFVFEEFKILSEN